MKHNLHIKICIALTLSVLCTAVFAQTSRHIKPRVIVSTDIGGTDPDDNQSMIHLLMFCDKVDIEGLVSSPSFGEGSAAEIKRMISIYEKDYLRLRKHAPGLASPRSLRRLCKQGRRGLAPFNGYAEPTEGSEWIVKQARKKSDRPLWILVWGTLEDVAQALHDAPDIKKNIRIYYIGGPNKKWGVNSYAYIAEHFPDVFMIENNSTYRGFITNNKDNSRYGTGFYDYALSGAGSMGADFIHYYKGVVKMGDSPSLFYVMDGDTENPEKDCQGGRFVRTTRSSRRIFSRQLTLQDTVPVYSVMELRFRGPQRNIPADSVCFSITIDKQKWDGYYIGGGEYAVRYSPKAPATLTYTTSSAIKELDGLTGTFVADGIFQDSNSADDYRLGNKWYTDVPDKDMFDGIWQGAKTILKHREAILEDWAMRLRWLKP